jgi:eukaryotic-like serine/threonine-protein kinase
MPLLIASQSELIPGYRLVERLGQGGFGEVWKAEAPGGLFKAVKIIHGSLSSGNHDSAAPDQELKALQRVKAVRHPFILSLDRFDIIEGRLIIVSELADRTLFDRFQECRAQGLPGIPRRELLRYMEETAEALDLMNEQFNLQHLDIKPQNLFLLCNHIKVGDFGLVKDLQGMFAQITSGVTAVYASPETFEGTVSRFSDQYNLAIAFQELLTGRLPYDGATGRQLMLQHIMGVPNLEPLPPTDQPVVGRALSKKPEERYPSCLDFVHALRQSNASALQEAAADSAPASPAVTPITSPSPTTANLRAARCLSSEDGLATPRPGQPPVFSRVAPPVGQRLTKKPSDLCISFEPPPPSPERPETTGDGVLMPALVTGLGGLGREVLQQLRKSLRKRDPNEPWPHIRLLHVDTDPEGYEYSTRVPDSLLSPGEALVTPFQRTSYYLQQRRQREEIEQWLPLSQLITVPRGQTSAGGWRALGRLAFVTCAAVAARLRQELEACCEEKPLQDVVRRTALGLRSSRPRAYVVASLTGGTGSGMFLEMAGALRRELQQLGHPHAEVIGVLLVPAVKQTGASRGVANSYAALAELNYFARAAEAAASSKNGRDHARRSGADKPPFDRCVLLPLPASSDDPAALNEWTTLAGDFLCRELTSRLGRSADEERAALGPQSTQGSAPGMICQTFGAYWFSVPRRPLLENVAQQICDRLVRSWKIDDPKALDEAIKTWATDQLNRAELSAEPLAASLRGISANSLGQKADALFDSLAARWSKGGPADLRRSPEALPKALEELEKLLGPAEGEPSLDLPSPPAIALREASRVVAEQAEARLAEVTLNALAEPHFRFACMEAAAQAQLGVSLEEAARLHKRASEEKCRQALDVLQQVSALKETLQASFLFLPGAKARAAASIVQNLGQYLATRWDGMVALALSRVFQDLQVNLCKYRRSLDCCQKRIGQFLKTFGPAATNNPWADLGLGRYLLPFGCRTLEEAVKRILDSLPPAEESALHADIWDLIRATLRDNVHVCTAPVSLFRGLRERIDREVEKVAEDSLGRAHAAEAYLEQHIDDSGADDDLTRAFDEAQPELASLRSAGQPGFCILAVPPGPEGERFRALVRHALPDMPMRAAASTDDIIFYREQPHLCLTDLPQLGPTAREIYQQVLATEQYSPHSRTDITAW